MNDNQFHPIFDPDLIATVKRKHYPPSGNAYVVEVREPGWSETVARRSDFSSRTPGHAVKRVVSAITGVAQRRLILERLTNGYYAVRIF